MKRTDFRAILLFLVVLLIGFSLYGKEHNKTSKANYELAHNVPVFPKRIVSLSASTDEILLDLVQPERIAALTYLADDPQYSAVTAKAKFVPERVRATELEKVISLEPDLVLAPDWLEQDQLQVLKQAKVPLLVCHTPKTFTEIEVAIKQIAAVCNNKLEGEMLVERMEKVLAPLRKMRATSKEGPVVLALSSMGSMGGADTTFHAMCEELCLRDGDPLIINNKANGGATAEQILTLQPDYLLFPESSRVYAESLKEDPVWKQLEAVQKQSFIFVQDRYLFTCSHYAVEALREMQKQLPEIQVK